MGYSERMLTIAFEVILGVIGLALMGFGIYGVIRDKFSTQTSGGALGGQITLPLSGLLVILGLVSLGFAAYLQTTIGTETTSAGQGTQISESPTNLPSQSFSQTPVTPSVSPATSTIGTPSASIAATSSHKAAPTSIVKVLKLTCSISKRKLLPGTKLTMTYHVSSPTARQVGLGAGVYDEQGNDDSNGDGDVPSIALQQGVDTLSRPVTIPPDLSAGQYELDAEIWPPNEVGQDNVNDLIDAPCTYFQVP